MCSCHNQSKGKNSCCGSNQSCCSQSCCDSNCGCGCQSSQCCDSNCNKGSECGDKFEKLLCLADQAWMEVLKEKIKEHIRSNDHKIDEIAKFISETNHERWKCKMEKEQKCSHNHKKLEELFGCTSSSCQSGFGKQPGK